MSRLVIKGENKHGFTLYEIPLNIPEQDAETIIKTKLPHKALFNYVIGYYNQFTENAAQVLQDVHTFMLECKDSKFTFYRKKEEKNA